MRLPRQLSPISYASLPLLKIFLHTPYRAITPPDRVIMPMAPTFCLRSVFWTPAMMAPIAVVWRVVLAVLERASRGWKVGWSAMAGGLGVYVVLRALSTVRR
jgi:hypothetical protein